MSIKKIKINKTSEIFLLSLFADQVHDFLEKKERSILFRTAGKHTKDRSTIDDTFTIKELLNIWKVINRKGGIFRKMSNMLNKSFSEGLVKSSGFQRSAEYIIEHLCGAPGENDYIAISRLINNIVGYSENSDLLINDDESETDGCKSNPFTSKYRKINFPRPLLPVEFNCYKALLKFYGENHLNKNFINLNLIIDATKQRETSISNILIDENAPNDLCKGSKCEIPFFTNTLVTKILPNYFDMAGRNALETFQFNLFSKNQMVMEEKCHFQYICEEETNAILDYKIIRLPTILEVLFNYMDYGLLSIRDMKLDPFYKMISKNNKYFSSFLFQIEQNCIQKIEEDIIPAKKNNFFYWTAQDPTDPKSEPQLNPSSFLELLKRKTGLVNEFLKKYDVTDKGKLFYLNNINITNKIENLQIDLQKLFVKILAFFIDDCGYMWENISSELEEYTNNTIEYINSITSEYKVYLENFKLFMKNNYRKHYYYTFLVESISSDLEFSDRKTTNAGVEIINNISLIHLSFLWFNLLNFLNEKYNLTLNVLENQLNIQVISDDIIIDTYQNNIVNNNFNTYIFNKNKKISSIGAAVGNISLFINDLNFINNFIVPGKIYSAVLLNIYNCIIKFETLNRNTCYIFVDIYDEEDYIDFSNEKYEISIEKILIPMFFYGYISFFQEIVSDPFDEVISDPNKKIGKSIRLSKTVIDYTFIALLNKTLCDLSMSGWVANKNQSIDIDSSNDCYLYLTFDKTSSYISNLMNDMKNFTLLQNVKYNTIMLPKDNDLFNNDGVENKYFIENCRKSNKNMILLLKNNLNKMSLAKIKLLNRNLGLAEPLQYPNQKKSWINNILKL